MSISQLPLVLPNPVSSQQRQTLGQIHLLPNLGQIQLHPLRQSQVHSIGATELSIFHLPLLM